jgi:hypothetical protein
MDFTFPGEVGKIKGHWKYTSASEAVQTFATDSSWTCSKIAPPILINEILLLTVYPVAFPQFFKQEALTFSEIIFLIVHEDFKVWKNSQVNSEEMFDIHNQK